MVDVGAGGRGPVGAVRAPSSTPRHSIERSPTWRRTSAAGGHRRPPARPPARCGPRRHPWGRGRMARRRCEAKASTWARRVREELFSVWGPSCAWRACCVTHWTTSRPPADRRTRTSDRGARRSPRRRGLPLLLYDRVVYRAPRPRSGSAGRRARSPRSRSGRGYVDPAPPGGGARPRAGNVASLGPRDVLRSSSSRQGRRPQGEPG